MVRLSLVMLITLAACSPSMIPVPADVICRETRAARAEHMAALLEDGGDRSVLTGQRLVSLIDSACAG